MVKVNVVDSARTPSSAFSDARALPNAVPHTEVIRKVTTDIPKVLTSNENADDFDQCGRHGAKEAADRER